MPISSLGAAHVAAAVAALTFGLLVFVLPKGTQLHRAMGFAYTAAMVAVNIAALGIYRSSGHFGPFHLLALLTLATIVGGIVAASRGRIGRHYQMMSFSYLGLLSALATQMLIQFPFFRGGFRGMAVGIASALLFTAGGAIILPRLQRRVLRAVAAD